MDIKRFVDFVVARHLVYVERTAGNPKPWTNDRILQTYRFCNVYRELDTVTRYIRGPYTKALRKLGMEPRDLWFAMVVARLINWPDSLEELVPVVACWDAAEFTRVMDQRKYRGRQTFGPAYIVSTNGQSIPKAKYIAEYVLEPLYVGEHGDMRPEPGQTLQSYHAALMQFQGMGSFMAAQVVADVKNTRKSGLHNAPDWMTWAAPGPGSLRGLSRVMGRGGSKTGWKDDVWLQHLHILQTALNEEFARRGWAAICAQDTQNCLCEFDKYERVRLGEGAPKQRYDGGKDGGQLF